MKIYEIKIMDKEGTIWDSEKVIADNFYQAVFKADKALKFLKVSDFEIHSVTFLFEATK